MAIASLTSLLKQGYLHDKKYNLVGTPKTLDLVRKMIDNIKCSPRCDDDEVCDQRIKKCLPRDNTDYKLQLEDGRTIYGKKQDIFNLSLALDNATVFKDGVRVKVAEIDINSAIKEKLRGTKVSEIRENIQVLDLGTGLDQKEEQYIVVTMLDKKDEIIKKLQVQQKAFKKQVEHLSSRLTQSAILLQQEIDKRQEIEKRKIQPPLELKLEPELVLPVFLKPPRIDEEEKVPPPLREEAIIMESTDIHSARTELFKKFETCLQRATRAKGLSR